MLLHQAIEKYLKGFLLGKGWALKRTHDLTELLDEALVHAPELAEFDTVCIKITADYTEQRYPPLAGSDITKAEVLQSLVEATPLVEASLRLSTTPI
jgi:HEPN domain-containing protein